MAKDYYVILGLGATAGPEDVRAAYRRRALELHPDRSGGGSGPFLDLQEAYAVLSDPERRTAYDRQRDLDRGRLRVRSMAEPLRAPARRAEPFREQQGGGGGWGEPIGLWTDFESYMPGFEELADRWWRNFGMGTRPKGGSIQTLTVEVPLSREEARWGGEVEIQVPVRAACHWCGGRGSVGYEECWHCRGEGFGVVDRPLRVGYPPALLGDHEEWVALDGLGVENLCLRVWFRVRDAGI